LKLRLAIAWDLVLLGSVSPHARYNRVFCVLPSCYSDRANDIAVALILDSRGIFVVVIVVIGSFFVASGAAAMTPWMEAIDTDTGKLFFKHPKTDATAWVLPKGSVVDTALSLQNKIAYIRQRLKTMRALARQALSPDRQQLKLDVHRCKILEDSLGVLRLASPDELLAGPLKVSFVDEVCSFVYFILVKVSVLTADHF
jgi:hypothetical protein